MIRKPANLILLALILMTGQIYAQKDNSSKIILQSRDGLPNFFKKVKANDSIVIAYLGGSITEMEGYRSLSIKQLSADFPSAKFKGINAGVPGTGSGLGAFRLQNDVLRFKPDLIFVEFAVNDAFQDSLTIYRSMEGIVRKIKKTMPNTDICFLYTISESMIINHSKVNSIKAMESVATHYGITAINMGTKIAELLKEGHLIIKPTSTNPGNTPVFSKDGTHPTADGHKIYAEVLHKTIQSLSKQAPVIKKEYQKALRVDNYENANVISAEKINAKGNWIRFIETDEMLRFLNVFPKGIVLTNTMDSITFQFTGSSIGLDYIIGPSSSGDILLIINNSKPLKRHTFDKYAKNYRRQYTIIDGLENKRHTVTIKIDPSEFDKTKFIPTQEMGDPSKYQNNNFYLGNIMLN